MSFLDKLKTIFQGEKLDVAKRYEFVREAVAGTMSKFRVARDFDTGDIVGLKLLDPDKFNAFEARFKGLKKPSEGTIALSIKHPRIVETYQAGLTTTGLNYIVMEYIQGPGLNLLIQNRESILVGNELTLIRQMAEAIEAVHQAGFIHRDICPRNFICSEDATSLKLIDFGLTLPDSQEYRQPGNRTGTPLYMAPEIVRRRWTDKRVDLFAFGVTAYRLCTFEMPWKHGETTGLAALHHDTNKPTDIREHRPQMNPTLATAIMSCLEPNPDDRPESADQFLQILRRVKSMDET